MAFDLRAKPGQDLPESANLNLGMQLVARMELQWAMANYGRRFPLMEAGAACRSMYGVYLLYHDGDPHRPLLIGRGEIRHHLRLLASDPEIAAFSVLGILRATWAAVPEQYAAGVESYLIEQLDPRLRPDSIGSAVRVPVNLPTERTFTAATILPRRPSARRRQNRLASVLQTFVKSSSRLQLLRRMKIP
jgi:hypothetical protein